jgi:hypothetical protein
VLSAGMQEKVLEAMREFCTVFRYPTATKRAVGHSRKKRTSHAGAR